MSTTLQEASWSIVTHNGTVTITNPETGNHRTFRVRTQKEKAKFKPGVRLVGLLTGADNTSSYTNFGEVRNDGTIKLWRKKQTDLFRKYVSMLEHPEQWEGRVEYLFSGTCRRCNRKLTVPESIKSGIGPICADMS